MICFDEMNKHQPDRRCNYGEKLVETVFRSGVCLTNEISMMLNVDRDVLHLPGPVTLVSKTFSYACRCSRGD